MAGVSNQTVEHDAKTRGIILHIVEQIKSQGVFDRFRRDCLEELDSKEPYRQLKQRVESHVATFLSKQMFSANLPKNQLRTSLRANINQSEVLSKGVDRLLEQVLVEKSIPFYKEIENLVEEHLISTGHYTRYDRDKPQRLAERDGPLRSEHAKLSDKEVEDIIKEETNKFLEASADGGKSQESDKNLHADSPPPGTSGEVIEVETLISSNGDNISTETSTVLSTNVDAIEKSETSDLSSVNADEKLNVGIETSGEEAELKVKTQSNEQVRDSEVFGTKIVSESQQDLADATASQEIDAQMHEQGNSASACNPNLDHLISKPETIPESNRVKPSAIPSLQSESETVDVEVEPSSLGQNATEEGKSNENVGIVPEMKGSEGYKPSVEYTQAAAATLVKGANINEQNASELELQVLESEVKLGQSKGEVEKLDTQIEATDNSEITKASTIHKSQVDNQEIYSPEEGKSRIDKPEVLEPKVGQLEVVIPEVGKPKVDKTPKPEEKTEQTAAEKNKLTSKESLKQATEETISIPNVFSTDEETDEDLGITEDRVIPRSKIEESKPKLAALDIGEWSDSDITVSSVHTSDLSSLEDSMSDMEYEDYQELALKKGKQRKTGESSAGTSKEIDGEENNCDESSAETRKKIDSKDESEEEAGECCAGARQKIDESPEKYGESIAKEIDGKEENEEGKCEESGAGSSEDRKCDSKEDNTDVSPGDSTDSVHLQESRLLQSQATAPKRLETSDNPLPDPMLVDNQTSQNCPQETAALSTQSSEPVATMNMENVVPEVEPVSSYDSEPAQATDANSNGNTDDEIALGDTDIETHQLGKRKHLRRISTEQESESSNDIQTPREEQREPHPQRRSARVASKDKSRSDEKDDSSQANIKEREKGEEAGDSSRRLRRRHSSQEKGHDLRRSTSKEERRNERAEKRAARLASDSNDSDVKASKRSKRQVRPTRCYSPSENS